MRFSLTMPVFGVLLLSACAPRPDSACYKELSAELISVNEKIAAARKDSKTSFVTAFRVGSRYSQFICTDEIGSTVSCVETGHQFDKSVVGDDYFDPEVRLNHLLGVKSDIQAELDQCVAAG